MVKVYVLTSDRHLWAVQGFAHLFQRYWSTTQPVVVAGFTPPGFRLPPNFSFHSIGLFADYPFQKWSNALIDLLRSVEDDHVILMLEDYWLCRPVDVRGVETACEWIATAKDALRVDLTDDRVHMAARAGLHCRNVERVGNLEIVEAPACPYQMSVMAGVWNRRTLLSVLEPNLTPWQVEVGLTKKVCDSPYKVYATRQWPVKYILALRGADPTKLQNFPCFGSHYVLGDGDIEDLRQRGMLPG